MNTIKESILGNNNAGRAADIKAFMEKINSDRVLRENFDISSDGLSVECSLTVITIDKQYSEKYPYFVTFSNLKTIHITCPDLKTMSYWPKTCKTIFVEKWVGGAVNIPITTQKLHIENCAMLKTLECTATESITIVNCPRITSLSSIKNHSNVDSQLSISISDCKGLDNLEYSADTLGSLSISGCDNLKTYSGGPAINNDLSIKSCNNFTDIPSIPNIKGTLTLSKLGRYVTRDEVCSKAHRLRLN